MEHPSLDFKSVQGGADSEMGSTCLEAANRRREAISKVCDREVASPELGEVGDTRRRYRELAVASEELERQLRDRQELLRLSQTLLTSLDQTAVFEQIALLLAALVGYDALDVALVDELAGELVVDFAVDAVGDRTLGFRMPLGRGVCGGVALSGTPEMVNDMLADPRGIIVPGTRVRPQASIFVPLTVNGATIGVLSIDRFGGAVFEQREFELSQLVTNLAAIALRNARLYGEMQSRAATDSLTGLYNRGALDERLEEEVSRARLRGSSVSVLMIDIDDFKPFNDSHGHLCGDRMLRELAAVLRATTREHIDAVARYGGEEFVVVLPDMPPGTAVNLCSDGLSLSDVGTTAVGVAERVRRAVRARYIPGGDARGHPVTVSVGVAAYPDHADSVERLLANADEALYLAKELGKDRVEVFR